MSRKKIGRNETCPCGSGKKYKRCCFLDKEWSQMMNRKIQKGELPFQAYIESNGNTAPVSMKVSNVIFGDENGEKELLSNELLISNNTIKGDKGKSSARIKIPMNDEEVSIEIKGNAKVQTTKKNHFNIELFNGKLKEKISGNNNLFAKIRVINQRDMGYDLIDIIFGERGKKEVIIDGKKDRPHISFYSEGDGKFIRLAEYKCIISQKSTYINKDDKIIPGIIEIELIEYNQNLRLELDYNESENKITITKISFVNRSE